jgi:phosphatidylinositol phospholipase C delta
MVTKTFGDMLYRPETDQLREFPSPESLKKKVMISTKPPKEYLETPSSKSTKRSKISSKKEQWNGETASKSDSEICDKVNPEFTHSGLILNASRINLFFNYVFMYFTEQHEEDEGESLQEEDEQMTVPEYRHLISINAGKPKGALQNWLSIDEKKVRRLSLSEQELENATRRHGADIIR